MTVPLQLRASGVPAGPVAAWFLAGDSATHWIGELVRAGLAQEETRLFVVPRSVRDRSPIGLLVVPDPKHPATASPAGTPCRCVAGRLFVPVEAAFHPQVLDSEMGSLCPFPVAFLHPTAGLSGFDAESTRRVRDLVELPEEVPGEWNRARTGAPPLPELAEVSLQKPASLDELFQKGDAEIGTTPPSALPPTPGAPAAGALEKASEDWQRKFAEGVRKAVRHVPGGARKRTWVDQVEAWALSQLQRLDRRLDELRRRELARLLELLEKDPEVGLRHAIPMNSFGTRGVAPPSARLGSSTPEFDPTRMGGGPADYWDVPPEIRQALAHHYRDLANRELRLGRHRRAAYIFAHLLGDLGSAANAFKQGRHFAEAAFLYEQHLNNPVEAAACFTEGGQFAEALAIYARLERWIDAAALFERLGQPDAAIQALRKAVAGRVAAGDTLAAARLLEERLHVPEEALALLLGNWPGGRQAVGALAAALALLGRLGRHEESRRWIHELTDGGVPAGLNPAVASLLADLARDYPDAAARHIAADVARIRISRQLVQPALPDEEASHLMRILNRLAPADRLLVRDTTRHLDDRRERARVRRPVAPTAGPEPLVVRRFALPHQLRWLQLKSEAQWFFALGLTGPRLSLFRGAWEGESQALNWDCAPGAAADSLMLEPGSDRGRTVLLARPSGPGLTLKPFPATDMFFHQECTAGTPAWLPASTQRCAFSPHGAWTLNVTGGRVIVSAHSRQGDLLDTRDLTEALLDDAERVEGRIGFTAFATGVAVALGKRLVVLAGDHIGRLDFPGTIEGLVATPPYVRAGLTILLEHGAHLHWSGVEELIELDRDLVSPLAAFVPGGPLVLLSGRDGRLIDADAGGIRRVTRFEFDGRQPVGVVPAANTGHFGVLDVAGQLTLYRVPST